MQIPDNNEVKLVTLILRDPGRTDAIRAQIRSSGGRALSLPTFRYEPVVDDEATIEFLRNPNAQHWILFASPQGVASLRQVSVHNKLPLPLNMPCAAPGAASRRALLQSGFANITAPPGVGDLETLLRNQLTGLAGKRIALVQRVNAPIRASQLLVNRKAIPKPLQCYQRLRCDSDVWERLPESSRSAINSIIAYDAGSLKALLEIVGDESGRIADMPVAVIHPSIDEKAQELGFKNIITAGNATTMIKGLHELLARQPS